MQTFTDQMGRSIELKDNAHRIISLVPSQTELLHYLGLGEKVLGITKFCIHPEAWFRTKKRIGGTKQLKFDLIDQLQPDLIIGNKEENNQEQIENLSEKYPVWMSDIQTLEDAYEMIQQIGAMTGSAEKALGLCEDIKTAFNQLETQIDSKPLKVAYFIWQKPYMVAGGDTFINHMLELAGFENIFKDAPRYPEINLESLNNTEVEVLLLSSEPFPFKEKHIEEFKKLCPEPVIQLVDGELFSWYGNRLLHAAPYFSNLNRELNGLLRTN